jgi:hypothetical protein
MPSATEQLLDFVEIPRDTELPRKNPQATYDYSIDAITQITLQLKTFLLIVFQWELPNRKLRNFRQNTVVVLGPKKLFVRLKVYGIRPCHPHFSSRSDSWLVVLILST